MDYEKKYKGALARCKWLLSEGMISRIAATDLFRELMDNDSENIRKVIINIFHSLAEGKIPVDINYADIFTWLEKQGKKSTDEMIEALRTEYEKGRADAIAEIQEWSEEDEKMMNSFLHKVEVCNLLSNKENVWIINKLKSLKQRIRGEQ